MEPISAQCPSCGLHEIVAVQLARGRDGSWKQQDAPHPIADLLKRVLPGKKAASDEDTPVLEVQIDACPVCMGAWFDRGELDALSGDLGAVEKVLDEAEVPARRPCPRGHGGMVEQNLPGLISTPVDRCRECGGIWLDGHERRKLALATTSEGQGTKTERWVKRGAIWAAQALTHLPVEVDNPARGTPWAVFSLLALLFVVFFLQIFDVIDTYKWGLVSGRLVRHGDWWTAGTYMFLHGTWLHILGNAYFLYTFGDNIEHLFGRARFILLFVGAGVLGAIGHIYLSSATGLPVVGASGCISGVLGAYLWAFPRRRLFQVILWIQVKIPMWVYLFVWIGFHLVVGFFGSGAAAEGTAWFAHLGGALLGLLMAPLALRWRRKQVSKKVRVPSPLPDGAPLAEAAD